MQQKYCKQVTNSKCRLCQQFYETAGHIISACPILATEHYIERHVTVCAQLHLNICKNMEVKLETEHWHEHVPKSVETNHEDKTSWSQQVKTDRTIPNSKLDTIIYDNEKGMCMLIDVAILGDRNMINKDAKKLQKYYDLTTEIECMWNVKKNVIPVIIKAYGTI